MLLTVFYISHESSVKILLLLFYHSSNKMFLEIGALVNISYVLLIITIKVSVNITLCLFINKLNLRLSLSFKTWLRSEDINIKC